MVKLIDELCISDSTAHISWSTEQSKQLTDTVRNYLIQQNTEYVSHSVATFIHPKTQKNESYVKVATYIIGKKLRRKKIWYVCRPSNQNCNNTSIFDSYERFDIHMIQQHEPNITNQY